MKTSSKIAIGILITLVTAIVAFASYALYVVKELSDLGLDFSDDSLDLPEDII